MDFAPLGISPEQAEEEIRQAWGASYQAATNGAAIDRLDPGDLTNRIIHLLGRLAFRGIYFPQMRKREWVRVLFENRSSIVQVIWDALKFKYQPRPTEPLAIEVPEAAEPLA
jgi:hypothetical protein